MYTCCPAKQLRHNIKYIILLLALICLFAAHSLAHDGHNADVQRHFIWSVKSEKNTVYIVGSIHLLKQDAYPLPGAVENIYACCREVAFETDMDGMNEPGLQQKIMKRGLYPARQKLSDNISQETLSVLEKRLGAEGLKVEQFDNYRPWFIAMTIAGTELKRLGFDPELGIDRYFYQKAKKDGKGMIFLETNEMQIDLMASLNKRHQDDFLKGVLKELDVVETLAADMIDAWKTGDADKLDSILKISHAEEPDIYERFFIQRNRRWISSIQKLLKQDEDVLIVVGAGHLVGKDSVIELLKKKGYQVQQR